MFVFHLLISFLNSHSVAFDATLLFLSLALDAPLSIPQATVEPTFSHMSPLYRIILVAAYAASVALIAFPRVLPSLALAKPMARPLSSRTVAVHHVKERSVRVLKSKNSKGKAVAPHDLYSSRANVSHHPHPHSSTGPRVPATAYGRSGDVNIDVVTQNINILNNYYSKACNNAHTLSAYISVLLTTH